MTKTQIKANKMWVDVMKGKTVIFNSDEETRFVSKNSATMEVLDIKQQELAALIVSGKEIDMYLTMETMKLVMEQLSEAIEDFDDE